MGGPYSQRMDLSSFKERLEELNRIFVEENQHINLSAFRTEEQSWVGNVLDSAASLELEIVSYAKSIMDIGTGGGFPLLPLAICLPQCLCHGMDSTGKKLVAVENIASQLQLKNVKTHTGRAEELGHDPQHREKYDLVTSRAVSELPSLLEFCAPFVKVGGHIVLWKSIKIEKELNDSLLARAELSCQLVDQYRYELPGDWGERQLLVFEKRHTLKEKYPRSVGVPKKYPII